MTNAVSAVGELLPMQILIFETFDFSRDFNVTFTKNSWSDMEKAAELFKKVIFSFFQKTKANIITPNSKCL